MNVWQSRALTIALIGLIALFSVHIGNRLLEGTRADLTATDLYSLSEGSRQILDRMQEEGVKPLDVTLYFSLTAGKTLPKFIKDFITYERYLRNLLREYELASKGKVRLQIVDPVPDSEEAQDAADFGLDGKLINQHGDLFYFGLVFQTETGSRHVIEFLWPTEQENVEYQISKTLYNLLWPSSKKVGVLSSLQVMGGASDPFMAQMLAAQGRRPEEKWISMRVLDETYEVAAIPPDVEEISHDDYDLVLVVHPKKLGDKALWALDEWIQTGGNTLVFLDPYALSDRPPQDPQQPWQALQYRPSSELDPLLEAWGLQLSPDEFAADLELAVKRPLTVRGPAETVVIDLLITEEQRQATLHTESPILQGVKELRFLLAGSLERISDSGAASVEAGGNAETEADESEATAPERDFTATPFITTTPSGTTLHIEPGFGSDQLAYTDLNNAAKLLDAYRPGEEPVVLAYLLRGKLPSAYPEGTDYPSKEAERPPGLPAEIDLPPPEDAEMIHQDPVPEEERREATVLVFADTDFISDQIAFLQNPLGIVQAANDNHVVLLNAVDFLLGAPELMSVRAKRGLDRPFTLFDEIEAQAEKDTLEREQQLRADIETWQNELRDKQSEITQRNAALFQMRLQEEVDRLNERVSEANRELREIRQDRRKALERQESLVRFSVMGWMPIVVLGLGVYMATRRQRLHRQAGVSAPKTWAPSPGEAEADGGAATADPGPAPGQSEQPAQSGEPREEER
jgi:ABC-type uncharacterized transport system involved in gliding motility auxiliary subunit